MHVAYSPIVSEAAQRIIIRPAYTTMNVWGRQCGQKSFATAGVSQIPERQATVQSLGDVCTVSGHQIYLLDNY